MAELKNKQEPTFPSKRKPEDTEELPKKAPKLATLDHNETQEANTNSNDNNNSEAPSTNCSSLTEEKTESDAVPKEDGNDDNELLNDHEHDENDDDDDEDDEDEDDEESNDEAELDRKGKGVLRDDKGKGKLIEEDDEDDDSDDDDSGDDDGSVSGGDSDFSDDPLAEVDLNNILPSRTRRRTPLPGVHIASDTLNADEDDDDSDDSDA